MVTSVTPNPHVIFGSGLKRTGYLFQEEWVRIITKECPELFGARAITVQMDSHKGEFTVTLRITWRKGLTYTAEAKGLFLPQAWTDAKAIALRVIGQTAMRV